MDPAPKKEVSSPGVPNNTGPGALSNTEIAAKAFTSCAKAVNNKIPGSFSETSSTKQKVVKGTAIGGFFAVSVLSGYTVPTIAGTAFVGCVAYKAFKLVQSTNTNDSNQHAMSLMGAAPAAPGPIEHKQFTTDQISDWLFSEKKDPAFPVCGLWLKQSGRQQEKYAPTTSFSDVRMISEEGKYTKRIGIHQGGITDIRAEKGQQAAVGDSNNGDLLTGCGFAVATAIINATGPNLQRDLYNQFGVPKIMGVPEQANIKYGETEGRGYSIMCDSHDMQETHNIQHVEFMTVPMENEEGVRNMYREAFEHSKDLDFIVMPMAGMSHPVLNGKPELSAAIATQAFKEFVDAHPDSKLKVVFAIFEKDNVGIYEAAAKKLDQ